MRLYCIENGIKFLNMINYLFNRDFHSIMQIEYVNSFLQLVAEMVACRHYNTNADIVAPILIELFVYLHVFRTYRKTSSSSKKFISPIRIMPSSSVLGFK